MTFTVRSGPTANATFPDAQPTCTAITGSDGTATALSLTAGPTPGDLEVTATTTPNAACTFHLTIDTT
ncbi:hypothetical protein [Embleya sp. NPDC020630]|uniref:hypothetical protein n=1 Tax=Embleya sp. NPDC020630 TaxID=3363979 RepID=UPI00378DD232